MMQPISAGRPAPYCGIMRAECLLAVPAHDDAHPSRKNQCVVREAAIASTETGGPFTA
jgi:hypothetical protein